MNDILNELDLMTKSMSGEDIESEEVKTDPPSTDQPIDEDVRTDPPATDPPQDEVETDPPETDPPAATDPPIDERDAEIERLREKLAEKEADVKTEAPSTDAPYEEQDFVGDLDFDDLREDPKRFNTLLNDIYKKAVTDTTTTLNQQFSEQVPQMISAANAMKAAADHFYDTNSDLKPFKKAVAAVFNEVAAAKPNESYDKLMEETGVEARKRLGLEKRKETPKDKSKGKGPRLPRKKGRTRKPKGKDNRDPLQKELEEMNETLGR